MKCSWKTTLILTCRFRNYSSLIAISGRCRVFLVFVVPFVSRTTKQMGQSWCLVAEQMQYWTFPTLWVSEVCRYFHDEVFVWLFHVLSRLSWDTGESSMGDHTLSLEVLPKGLLLLWFFGVSGHCIFKGLFLYLSISFCLLICIFSRCFINWFGWKFYFCWFGFEKWI